MKAALHLVLPPASLMLGTSYIAKRREAGRAVRLANPSGSTAGLTPDLGSSSAATLTTILHLFRNP